MYIIHKIITTTLKMKCTIFSHGRGGFISVVILEGDISLDVQEFNVKDESGIWWNSALESRNI